VDDETGACLEPAAVVLHGLMKAGVTPGDDVAVIGLGTLGLLAVQLAYILGAGRVFAADLMAERRRIAETLGAKSCAEDGQGSSINTILDMTRGRGVDVVIEATGSPEAPEKCLELAGKGGHIVCLGLPERDIQLAQKSFRRLVREELTVHGSWNSYSAPFPGREWQAALHFMATGQLKTKPLITHRFSLDRTKEALMMMKAGDEFFVKVMLIPCTQEEEG